MANTLKFGDGKWAVKEGSTLAYNSENGNFKPLPFTFDRAGSATRVNKQGLIEVVSNNEPRIDFLNDSKGALLLEPSRSNSLLQSNQFDTTWSATNLTVTSGQIGVGGSTDAWKLSSTASSSRIEQSISTSGQKSYTIYAKKGSLNFIRVFARDTGDLNPSVYFNLSNGTIATEFEVNDATIQDVGNDWYRCEIIFTKTISDVRIYPAIADGDISQTSGDIYIQYAQLEQGSYATSYIPTQGSIGTRVAEQGVDGGAGTPVFSNTSAVWFIDLERIAVDADSSGSAMALRNSSFSQQIRLHFDAPTPNIRFRDGLNGFATISTIGGMTAGVRKKIALRIDGSTLSTFANGSKIGSDYTAPSAFDISEIDFSTLGFKIHDMRFNNTALTDQELINLTKI